MAILRSCVGCGLGIDDLYYLVVGSKFSWHLGCLKCSQCAVFLHSQDKCYLNNGKFYCVNDYVNTVKSKNGDESQDRLQLELKKPNNCQTCKQNINSNDYVIRLNSDETLLFHLDCFICHECRVQIAPGNQYGILNDSVYCHQHYCTQLAQAKTTDYTNVSQMSYHREEASFDNLPKTNLNTDLNNNPNFVENGIHSAEVSFASSSPVIQSSYCSKPVVRMSNNRKDSLKTKGTGQLSIGMISSLMSKKKRIRTSFKHQQLRIMKAHFQINQNPDSKDLKELSERTGLQKRVLQVWFQNSRAKQRKTSGPSILSNGTTSSLLDSTRINSKFSFQDEQNLDTNSNNSNIVSTNSSMNLDENETLEDDEDDTLDDEELSETDFVEDEIGDDDNGDDKCEQKTKSCNKKVKTEPHIYEANSNSQFFDKIYQATSVNTSFQNPNHNSISNIPLVDFYHYF